VDGHERGRKLADNQRRGLAGMGGRWLSTPNAWDPTEESVAQYTSEQEHDGVLHDDVEPPDSLSLRNKAGVPACAEGCVWRFGDREAVG
jgi:hypothetical protein